MLMYGDRISFGSVIKYSNALLISFFMILQVIYIALNQIHKPLWIIL